MQRQFSQHPWINDIRICFCLLDTHQSCVLDAPIQLGASKALMLIQSILDCGNFVSPLTTETKIRSSSLGLRCGRLKPPEKRDRPGAKKVLTRGAIEVKTKEVLARGSKRSRSSKIRDRPKKQQKRAKKVKNTGKRVFIRLYCPHIFVIICFLPQQCTQPQFFSFPLISSSFFVLRI